MQNDNIDATINSKEDLVNWLYDKNSGQLPDRGTFTRALDKVITNTSTPQ